MGVRDFWLKLNTAKQLQILRAGVLLNNVLSFLLSFWNIMYAKKHQFFLWHPYFERETKETFSDIEQ